MNAYLGLGSDRGNRAVWLRRGLCELRDAGMRLGAVSSTYLTEPVGDASLPWFLNCVAEIVDPPAPAQLLHLCLGIERQCDRVRRGGLEARSLDLDVLLYDQRVVDEANLTIPHPRMHERRFVLEPLVEIAPAARHPGFGRTASELLAALGPGQRVWLLAPPLAGTPGRD